MQQPVRCDPVESRQHGLRQVAETQEGPHMHAIALNSKLFYPLPEPAE
uniref:Auxin response factor n=1 Tax=Rhizophora mucronata TaxID=61149 RepID=A0A2P2KEP0_RHIMU